jgi:hypothetical protein
MRNASAWPAKVAALLKSGNVDGALAQIKVAPTVKDLTALQKLVAGAGVRMGSSAENTTVSNAIKDQIVALSSPRLHRSP